MSRSWLRGIAFGLVVVLALVPLSAVAAPGEGIAGDQPGAFWTSAVRLAALVWAEVRYALGWAGAGDLVRGNGGLNAFAEKDGVLIDPWGRPTPPPSPLALENPRSSSPRSTKN